MFYLFNMKEVQHLERALALLEPQMQFGGPKQRRYQPYPQPQSRPKRFKARAFHPKSKRGLFATGEQTPSGQPQQTPCVKFEIQFEVLGVVTIHNEERTNVRVLEIKEYGRDGSRHYSRRAQHTGKEVQIASYPTTRTERSLLRRVLIVTQAPADEDDLFESATEGGDVAFLDQLAWYIEVPYDTLHNTALEKSQANVQPVQPHTIPTLADLSKAAIAADRKVKMAEQNPILYWDFA